MKTGTKVAIIVSVIVILMIVGIVFLISLATKEKVSMTAEQFRTTMESKGYTVVDDTSSFSSYDFVNKVYVATTSDYSYQIEFYDLDSMADAVSFYNTNKAILERTKGSASSETDVSGKNFAKYVLSANGEYGVVSIINNTGIYLNVDDTYKNQVKNELDALGY